MRFVAVRTLPWVAFAAHIITPVTGMTIEDICDAMIEQIDMSQRSKSNTAKKDYETIFFQGGYSVGPR